MRIGATGFNLRDHWCKATAGVRAIFKDRDLEAKDHRDCGYYTHRLYGVTFLYHALRELVNDPYVR